MWTSPKNRASTLNRAVSMARRRVRQRRWSGGVRGETLPDFAAIVSLPGSLCPINDSETFLSSFSGCCSHRTGWVGAVRAAASERNALRPQWGRADQSTSQADEYDAALCSPEEIRHGRHPRSRGSSTDREQRECPCGARNRGSPV